MKKCIKKERKVLLTFFITVNVSYCTHKVERIESV